MNNLENTGWQRCPICGGEGRIPSPYGASTSIFQTCPTCYGDRLISKLTGYPRSYEINAGLTPTEPDTKELTGEMKDEGNYTVGSNGIVNAEYKN